MADRTDMAGSERFQVESVPPIPWAPELRAAARRAYIDAGLPTPKWERWKYTPLTRRLRPFYATPGAAETPSLDTVPASVLALDAYRLVLVNGRLRPDLSSLDGLPAGVVLSGLADAIDRGRGEAQEALGRLASPDGAPFVALNTAGFADGLYLEVAKNVTVERPIHLVVISIAGETPIACHPRHMIALAAGASATLVESHVAVGEGAYLSNGVCEVLLEEGASLRHSLLLQEGAAVLDIALTQVALAAKARYDRLALQMGAGLSRQEVNALLDGPRAECHLSGAYLIGGRGHADNTTRVDHLAPDTVSRQIFQGALDGRARGVFQGTVHVDRLAQRTDGHQLSRALLLSPEAEIDAKPELEIYADDVKCGHGATAGALDDDALFYLRARGIDAAAARRLLVEAFLMERVEAAPEGAVRDALATALRQRVAAFVGEPA